MARLRIGGVCVALLAAAWVQSLSRPDVSPKLDRALRDWIQHPTASARVLIQTRPDRAAIVLHRLAEHGVRRAEPLTSPGLLAADLSIDSLRATLRDGD